MYLELVGPMTKVTEIIWSEGYCYFLDYLEIAYYLSRNRNSSTNRSVDDRFSPVRNSCILELGLVEA